MIRLIGLLIFSVLIAACGSNQPKTTNAGAGKTEEAKKPAAQPAQTSEAVMWKIASYAGELGDNKNSSYITNSFAVWGTYNNGSAENTDLKVKFLVDKVSFYIKLYEYGKKIVKKGDENGYKITLKGADDETVQMTALNVSDRIFINEADAKKIIELFDKGSRVTFSMVSDSKTNPSTYLFALDHPGGFSEALKKLSH